MATTAVTTTAETPAPVAASGAGTAPLVRRRRGRKRLTDALLPIGVFVVLLGIWYAITYLVLDPARRFLMPAPHTIITDALLDGPTMEKIGEALGRTITVTFVGLVIAIVIGMAWAIAMSQSRTVERSLFPYAVALQCVPILALVPLIGFWFDYGFSSRVIVCVMIALFPVVSNTLFGLQSVDRGMHELFDLHGAGRLTRLLKLQLPAAMPAIFAGFRISAGLSVVGAIVGDLFFRKGNPGLGVLLNNFSSRLQGAELFLTIIVAAALGIAVFALFGWLGKLAVGRWYDQSRDAA
ncbi:ABC transporter, permease protein; membrane protein [Modestobacter italicus]|uniref:ABC transporter, permease protein membrane protein n=1 Tax=Modestobacter italicus (strain DSM 44449 / CECT 9708 / BC 501) TaxID=2732864 RepID=I4EU75_MODI5|nr:ABC transporter permease [Modestobacter marinus]CCH86938.1 ABC transporter, permease protein; membrane protein [Modestobacter marinus]